MIIQNSPAGLDQLLSQLQIQNLQTNTDKLKQWIRANIMSNFPDSADAGKIKEVFDAYQMLNQQKSLNSIVDTCAGYNVVHQAAKLGFDRFLEKCRGQLRPGLLAAQSTMGHTALHLAALEGHYCTLKLLLEMGADPNIVNNQHKYPIHLAAVMRGEIDMKKKCIQELLIQTHEKVLGSSDTLGRTLLHAVINFEDPALVKVILEKCPNLINLVDNLGQNLLHHILIHKLDALIDYFLSHENVDKLIATPTNNYSTALILACRYGNEQTVAKLLKHPQTVKMMDHCDEHQRTAIQWALDNGNENSINLLQEKGAKFEGRENNVVGMRY
jgi:ankyrin repeat protein